MNGGNIEITRFKLITKHSHVMSVERVTHGFDGS
jgi:hypothetical protein